MILVCGIITKLLCGYEVIMMTTKYSFVTNRVWMRLKSFRDLDFQLKLWCGSWCNGLYFWLRWYKGDCWQKMITEGDFDKEPEMEWVKQLMCIEQAGRGIFHGSTSPCTMATYTVIKPHVYCQDRTVRPIWNCSMGFPINSNKELCHIQTFSCVTR